MLATGTVVPHIGCLDGREHEDARDFSDLRMCFSMEFHQYLRQAGLNNAHICLIESELLSNTRLYYTLLAWTDYCNSYIELLDYFTMCIRNAYSKAYDKFRSKNLLSCELDEIETRLLMKAKEQDLPFTISEAARWLQNRSKATVRMHLNRLV